MVLLEDKAWVRTCERNERKKGTRVLPLYPLVPPTDDDRRCIIPPWLRLRAIQLRASTCRPLPVEYLLALSSRSKQPHIALKNYHPTGTFLITPLRDSTFLYPVYSTGLNSPYPIRHRRFVTLYFLSLCSPYFSICFGHGVGRRYNISHRIFAASFRFLSIRRFFENNSNKTSEFSNEPSHNRPSNSLFSSSVIFLPNSFFSIFLCTFYSKARSVSELGRGVTLSRKGRIFRLFSSLSGRKKRLNRALLVKSYGWCKIRRI